MNDIYEIQDKWATKTSTGIVSKGVYINKSTGKRYFVKGNSELGYLEPISEEIAYRIGKIVGIDTLPCKIIPREKFPEINVYGDLEFVSISPIVSYNITQFYEYAYTVVGKEEFDYLEVYKDMGLSQNHLYKMLLLDALVGNEDRHLNNFDVYYDYTENKVKNAVILDLGASLLYNVSERDLKIYEGSKIGPDKSKPFYKTHDKQISKIKSRLDKGSTDIEIKCSLEEFKILSSDIVEDVGRRANLSELRIESVKSYLNQRYKYYFLGNDSKHETNKIDLIW